MRVLLDYLPLLNFIGVLIYFLIIRKIDESLRQIQLMQVTTATTAATLAAHVAEDLRQFSRIEQELERNRSV